jgi:hypothetical protein
MRRTGWGFFLAQLMHRTNFIDSRSIYLYVPQTLPELQLELEALPNEYVLPPGSLEAKVEIFLVMFWLLHVEQVTSPILLVLNTSASNGLPQSAHTNSKMGMFYSAG